MIKYSVVAVLLALGCGKKDAAAPKGDTGTGSSVSPAAADSCRVDADCELVSGTPPTCCSRCSPTAMTKAAATAANAKCQEVAKSNPDYFSRCPTLSCLCEKAVARCESGECVVDRGPC